MVRKSMWWAKIVLLTADGHGTSEIIRRTGKVGTWRWREWYGVKGVPAL
jgi:hypothetical protein